MWEHAAGREETQRLLVAALCAAANLPVKDAYPTDHVEAELGRARIFPEAGAISSSTATASARHS